MLFGSDAGLRDERTLSRRFLRSVLWFAVLHCVALWLVGGIIYLVGHIPPRAVNLDQVLLLMFSIEQVLSAPRKLLLWLWLNESTPGWLSLATTLLNSLIWGLGLAGLRVLWRKLTT